MKRTNPMLLIDFYKAVHAEMLPHGITKSVSYFTPRMSRVKMWDNVVMFGLQGFIKTYLIDYFNDEFFNKPFDEVIFEYKRIMDATLGKDAYKIDKIEKLHKYVRETRDFIYPLCSYGKQSYPELSDGITVLKSKILSLTELTETIVEQYEEKLNEKETEIAALKAQLEELQSTK